MIFKILFRAFTGKAALEVEIADDIEPRFQMRAALSVVIGKAKEKGERADLSGANLSDADLSWANLSGADLSGADLSDADLSWANLRGADLSDADLSWANLSKAYLADALNANIEGSLKIDPSEIPVIPNIDAAILAAIEAGGTLDMGSWHGNEACGTTHCRAGWAIHLAGDAGYALEAKTSSQMAGAMIYRASRPGKPAPWFFDTTENALADLRKCAAEQAGA